MKVENWFILWSRTLRLFVVSHYFHPHHQAQLFLLHQNLWQPKQGYTFYWMNQVKVPFAEVSIPSFLLYSTTNSTSKSRTKNTSTTIRTTSSSPLLKSILFSPLESGKDSSINKKYHFQDVSLKGENKKSSHKIDIPPLRFNSQK